MPKRKAKHCQDIYDHVVRHILVQGRVACLPGIPMPDGYTPPQPVYLDGAGRQCAVGCLMKLKRRPVFNRRPLNNEGVMKRLTHVGVFLPACTENDQENDRRFKMLTLLMECHDDQEAIGRTRLLHDMEEAAQRADVDPYVIDETLEAMEAAAWI